jgi:hypothetical protein
LGRNLRGGHRAEALGVELLRALCAVAPVPQSEDVGFDAVATILRVDGRFLKAEHSFCVQFKARSVTEIAYDGAAYAWLRSLVLPLFIGSVDLTKREIALYTTHNVVCRVDGEHYHSATMRLLPPSSSKSGTLYEYLGDPILRWADHDMTSEEFQQLAYSVLAAWVAIEQLHQPLRSIKTTQMVRWRTNEVPAAGGTMLTGHPDDLRRDVESAAPYLMKIGTHFLLQETPTPEAIAFLLLANWFQENGIEHFKYLAQMLALRLASKGHTLSLELRLKNVDDENA